LRYAIISDIHSNLQALQEVLSLIDRLAVDRIICLGDIVGYGGDPALCIELVRQKCFQVILGNHDAAAVGLTSVAYFNPVAREAALWTGRVLTPREKSYLSGLPLKDDFGEFEIVHSTPDDPALWRYLFTEEEAGPLFDCFSRQLLFYGHTHFPMVFESSLKEVLFHEPEDFTLDSQIRYIVNVGSVGQPRDGDPRAAFALFDSGRNEVTFHRQPYDIAAAQRRILENGLPQILAARLAYGS